MTTTTSDASTAFFTAGDLVISVYGDGASTGTYGDNQAAPIVLEELDTDGTVVKQMELPQTTMVVNGVTENVISGEYGSSSEGTLELSADGQSLVIAGYGVNADTFNEGGVATYGTIALAQSTSVQGGPFTAVSRVIGDINYDGTVDTSTALFNVADGNNPRSVATVDGSSFYLSGQGQSGDTTQGVFYAQDGASSATSIDHSTDTRTVEIYNGQLYVSRDSKQSVGAPKYTSNISTYGTEPTTATTPTILAGITQSTTLTAATENGANNSDLGKAVALSPENFFFANATTLYVADGGNPKGKGLGDGGLQKWTLANGTWTLNYTLSDGLHIVANTATAGTTGLIGLTGEVVGNTVLLYATNATVGDLDQTYLYGITDTLSATTESGEAFTQLAAAAPDTNIRGVSFAPQAVCYYPGTAIRTPSGDVAVESLQIGDEVSTADGRVMPVLWMGRNTVATRFADPLRVLPIRITAGALAEGLPERDLLVSPDHALLIDGLLIHASALVNGATILRESRVPETFVYHHVELADHALILAEGVPAETFVDNIDRMAFDNWAEHAALQGEAAAIPEMQLPRAASRRQVPAATLARLEARAVRAAAQAA